MREGDDCVVPHVTSERLGDSLHRRQIERGRAVRVQPLDVQNCRFVCGQVQSMQASERSAPWSMQSPAMLGASDTSGAGCCSPRASGTEKTRRRSPMSTCLSWSAWEMASRDAWETSSWPVRPGVSINVRVKPFEVREMISTSVGMARKAATAEAVSLKMEFIVDVFPAPGLPSRRTVSSFTPRAVRRLRSSPSSCFVASSNSFKPSQFCKRAAREPWLHCAGGNGVAR